MTSTDDFAPWRPVATAVAALLGPQAEVVIHDLRTGCIAAVWNAGSLRRVGDESLIDPIEPDQDVWGPYPKSGAGGGVVRSVSAVIRSGSGDAVGLLCINLDLSKLQAAAELLSGLLTMEASAPAELFRGDWRERMQDEIRAWTHPRGLTPSALRPDERAALVAQLETTGLFETRRAADHAAALLGVSRSQIYVDLRRARDPDRTPEERAR